MGHGGFAWHERAVASLKIHWQAGLSGTQTASRLSDEFGHGFTRNAIIGKVTRLKLPKRKAVEPSKTNPPTTRKLYCRKVQRIMDAPGIVNTEMPQAFDDDRQIPIAQRRQFLELDENHDCHWPVGDPGRQGFFFCGHPSADIHGRRPYCLHHMQRALSHPTRGGAVGDYASAGRKAFHLRQAAKGGFDARDRLDDVGDAA